MSKRRKIVDALVNKILEVDGTGLNQSNLYRNVFNKLKFWDEVNDYPSVFLTTGTELREYLPGGFKWAYLTITIRIYVNSEEPETELELIFEDIERIIDSNGNLEYDTNAFIEDLKILSINTDEGLLSPIGVGEVTIQVMYDLET